MGIIEHPLEDGKVDRGALSQAPSGGSMRLHECLILKDQNSEKGVTGQKMFN